jgi:hypothetical protein
MTFSISVLVSSLDPYKSSAIALGSYGSLGMIPEPIWKRPCNNLYLSPLILKYPSLFCQEKDRIKKDTLKSGEINLLINR